MKNTFSAIRPLLLVVLPVLCAAVCTAQNMSFRYSYNFEPAMITEPPDIQMPNFAYPEEARKQGVDGKASVLLTLGEDGKTRNVRVGQSLPAGVTEALVAAANNMSFRPAKYQGKPVALDMTLEVSIMLIFGENDPAVKKPKITLQPPAIYPESGRAEKYKGKVSVQVIFFADGTLKVNGVSSFMPKDFDNSAVEAAKGIKFEPAIHKKSQKPVIQAMTIEFDFKP